MRLVSVSQRLARCPTKRRRQLGCAGQVECTWCQHRSRRHVRTVLLVRRCQSSILKIETTTRKTNSILILTLVGLYIKCTFVLAYFNLFFFITIGISLPEPSSDSLMSLTLLEFRFVWI